MCFQEFRSKSMTKGRSRISARALKGLRSILGLLIFTLILSATLSASNVTGKILGPNTGLPVANGTMTLTLDRPAVLTGTSLVVPMAMNCWTDSGGNIVGLPGSSAIAPPVLSANLGAGTLPNTAYFVKATWFNASGESEASPESTLLLGGVGTLIIAAPATVPSLATRLNVYIGTASGTETLQGFVTVTNGVIAGAYSQSVPLIAGAALPATNTSICQPFFNDTLIPSFTSYLTNIVTLGGSQISGYPQKWFLWGGNINVSQGTPIFSGIVQFPQAIVSSPAANGSQTINGPLNLNGFGLTAGTLTLSGSVIGSLPISGPSPWYDITANGAKCDGVTDDTAAINTTIGLAKTAGGGVVLIPPGKTCVFTSTIGSDDLNGVRIMSTGRSNGNRTGGTTSTGQPMLKYTGTTSPAINFKSAQASSIENIVVMYTNGGFSGLLIDTEHSASATDAAFLLFRNLTLMGTSASSGATCLLCFDKTLDTSVEDSMFFWYNNAIRGQAGGGSYSNRIQISNNNFNGFSGTAATTHITNPGQGWSIQNNTFEMLGVGNTFVLMDASTTTCGGCIFSGNWVGDAPANYTGTYFKIGGNAGALGGMVVTGNTIIGGSSNLGTFMSLASTSIGVNVNGNLINGFANLYTFTGSTQNSFVSSGNEMAGGTLTVTGASQSGAVEDSTYTTSYYASKFTQPASNNAVTLLNVQGPLAEINGTGAAINVYTFTVPANTIQAGKCIKVTSAFTRTTGAAAIQYGYKFGSTFLVTPSITTNASESWPILICNNAGVQNAQFFTAYPVISSVLDLGVNNGTSAENTANALAISLTFNVAAGTKVTPNSFLVELIQ
jgi:hypothetical protein